MKILITGATSGIGRQLALDYLRDNNEVWAVGAMQKGIAKRQPEIHLPKKFRYLLKFFAYLPHGLWISLAQRMKK